MFCGAITDDGEKKEKLVWFRLLAGARVGRGSLLFQEAKLLGLDAEARKGGGAVFFFRIRISCFYSRTVTYLALYRAYPFRFPSALKEENLYAATHVA